jgi:hypothetical protein
MKLLLALASLGIIGDVKPLTYNDGITKITTENFLVGLHVTNIMQRHFTHGRTVLFLLPETSQEVSGDTVSSVISDDGYMETMDIVLQKINDETGWPLRVLRPCTSDNATTFTKIEIYLNCIILIRSEENDGTTKNLVNQLQFLKNSFLFNPKAHFLFVITSRTTDIPSDLAFKILSASWKFMIGDVLLMVWSSYLNQNSANLSTSNDNVNVSLINLFTLFPYARENNCSDVKSVFLLATILLSDSREFIYNTDMFQERKVEDLYGCPVKVFTYHIPPAVVDVSKDGKANCTGLEINALLFILNHLNATVMYSILVEPLIMKSPTAKITELIDGLESGSADIALGALPLTLFLSEYADPTVPYFHTPVQWIVPCSKPLARWGTMFNVFSLSVWICLYSSMFLVGIVIYVIARNSEHPVYSSLQSSLLNVWSVALEISVHKMPKSFRVRSLFLIWVFVCLAFCIIFQALFTTYLVNPRMERKIDTTDDLIASGIEYGYSEEYNNAIHDRYFRANQRQCADVYTCLDNVIKYGNFATVSTAFHADYYRTRLSWHDRHLPVCKMKEDISRHNAVMYLTKGHPLLRRINKVIRTMVESGMIVKWTNDFLYMSRIQSRSIHEDGYREEANDWESEYVVFGLFHLRTAFCVLVMGHILSTFVVLLELIYYKLQIAHSVHKPARHFLVDHFQRRLKNNQDRFSLNRYLKKNQDKLVRCRKKATAS